MQDGSRCPKCGSADYTETVRTEDCRRCGYSVYYGDAHAAGVAQISVVEGKPMGISQEEYDEMLRKEKKTTG